LNTFDMHSEYSHKNYIMSSTQIIFTDNVEKYRKLVLEELKEFNIHCIGEAANGLELLRLLKEHHPEVVLLDLEMPVMDGSEALNQIMQLFPETRVIILSMHYESLLVEDYIHRGAKGYLPKDEIAGDISLLAKAIEAVKNGEIFVHHIPPAKDPKALIYSTKQKVIAPMICQGLTNEEIAVEMNIGVRGVEKLRSKIYAKLDGGRAVDFYRYAFSKGLQFLGAARKQK